MRRDSICRSDTTLGGEGRSETREETTSDGGDETLRLTGVEESTEDSTWRLGGCIDRCFSTGMRPTRDWVHVIFCGTCTYDDCALSPALSLILVGTGCPRIGPRIVCFFSCGDHLGDCGAKTLGLVVGFRTDTISICEGDLFFAPLGGDLSSTRGSLLGETAGILEVSCVATGLATGTLVIPT